MNSRIKHKKAKRFQRLLEKGVWNASAGYGYLTRAINAINTGTGIQWTEEEKRNIAYREITDRYERKKFESLVRQFKAANFFAEEHEHGEFKFEIFNLQITVEMGYKSRFHTAHFPIGDRYFKFETVREFEKILNNKGNWIPPPAPKIRPAKPIDINIYLKAMNL